MMNQGPTVDSLATLEPSSVEKHQGVDSSQPHTSLYYIPAGSTEASWTTHLADNYSRENGSFVNSSYHQDQQPDPSLGNAEDGQNMTSVASGSSSGGANVTQDYTSYTNYTSTDPYGYTNTGYAAYYNGYQQQPNQSYSQQQPDQSYSQQQPDQSYSQQQPNQSYSQQQPNQSYSQQQPNQSYSQQQPNQSYSQQQPNQSYSQPVGAYQNTGAPYQPLSSFQNTGSYAGPPSYSSTYYNHGDYQTSGGYTSGAYNNQSNMWHGGQYASYTSHQYPNYTSDSNAGYNSAGGVAAYQYQQHNKQWADYYSQTQTEVSCAPGTENISVPSASNLHCPVPSTSSGYPAANSQPSAPYTPSWRPESSSAESPSVQPVSASGSTHDDYWKHVTQVYQNQQTGSAQLNIQKPIDANPPYEISQYQQPSTHSQVPTTPYAASLPVPQSFQSSPQPVSSNVAPLDPHRVSKMQIPTNPRIASNLTLGLQKTDKEVSTSSAAVKPAYVSIALPKSNDKASSQNSVDSVLKPGMFPKSLRSYVERALARCKNEMQMAASQAVMKEIITKATADGTLHSKDWDTEPLFPLLSTDTVNKEGFLLSTPVSSKNKRSPSRRTKSRWEPVVEEKPINKPAPTTIETAKYGNWNKQFSGGKSENRMALSTSKTPNRDFQRPAKRQRFGDGMTAADNGEVSSDSDKEQSLTAYYSAAMALADSPEERKRRENRSKRFDKGHGKRPEKNHFRPKSKGTVDLYTRRATALVISKTFDESGSRAVEDIDWDSLTVRGTCQEIEKRYLRLTSAPDPAMVRPEEVLEKALDMVQNSEKNYLYKCDQLKSIRQDLTVQRIRNELTVKVYETHARLAIEVGDLPEINQCQSQLKTLYAEGIKGCHMEFAAYNLLCVILHSNNNRDLLSAMSRLSAEARKNEAVKHALAVRSSVTSGNYVLFFRLYKTAPNLNTWLMDRYVEKMRYAAVKCMSRSYRPTVPVSYIAQVLGFSSANESDSEKDLDGVEECSEWLKAHGACLTSDNSGEMLLDTKASMSSLYIPEPEDAVAHGDANLAVNDFFARQPVQSS